jgi:hypothetical protein
MSPCLGVTTCRGRIQRELTYDDFVLFPDDGKRHELIDGSTT